MMHVTFIKKSVVGRKFRPHMNKSNSLCSQSGQATHAWSFCIVSRPENVTCLTYSAADSVLYDRNEQPGWSDHRDSVSIIAMFIKVLNTKPKNL